MSTVTRKFVIFMTLSIICITTISANPSLANQLSTYSQSGIDPSVIEKMIKKTNDSTKNTETKKTIKKNNNLEEDKEEEKEEEEEEEKEEEEK